MQHIWAPWRMEYIESDKGGGCIFCDKSRSNEDEKNLVVWRGGLAFVLLNLFPYNPGHLMVAPYVHKAELADLDPAESAELFSALSFSVKVLKKTVNPDGFNIGVNLGRVAGAGVEEHIHFHVVPRWSGDTNFMPVLADIKVIPEHLQQTWKKLKDGFDKS